MSEISKLDEIFPTLSTDNYAIEVVVRGIPSSLSYILGQKHKNTDIGDLVDVPLGNRSAQGWVIDKLPLQQALEKIPSQPIKKIQPNKQLSLLTDSQFEQKNNILKEIFDAHQAFLPDQLKLFKWMAEYYGCSLAEIIETAIPQRTSGKPRLSFSDTDSNYSYPRPEKLTLGQEQALMALKNAVSRRQFETFLLFGVTGSGKTEVYLQTIEHALALGGSVLVMVPEIALTPQVVDQFKSRLNQPLALLHSAISPSQRWFQWNSILQGNLKIAIGARSAVFAPLKDLSLIILDEEHENSYKQSDSVRYHARDTAIKRAQLIGCPIILGSATPSFESLLNVKKKRYRLLEMPDRATSRPVPSIEIINLAEIRRKDMPSANISPQLQEAIQQTLDQKGQIILLYNRRGFSSYLQCDSCGEVLLCPHCSVAFTFHKKKNILICHYCSTSLAPPSRCQFCRDPQNTRIEIDPGENQEKELKKAEEVGLLSHRGGGTERIVEELQELFPSATIIRMDRDTITTKNSYREILGSIRTGEADILVGTQMIAKGHDLPGVTLVGVIDADVGLHIPDFRSSEKVFQLITQAAGRAGRGKDPGRVLVQTRKHNHPTIIATATGRFLAFSRFELDHRNKLGYPPWTRLMRLIISCTDKYQAEIKAHQIFKLTSNLIQDKLNSQKEPILRISTLGPAPAPHEKLRNRYRWHILIKSNSARSLSELALELNYWKTSNKKDHSFRLAIDIDPVEML